MKASFHTGREGLAIHNDRTYDYSKDDHIDKDKVKNNIYISYKNLPFLKAEKEYYKDHYKKSLMKKNKRYRENSQMSKVKTIGDMLTSKRTRPEEVILQIGGMKDHPDDETFIACSQEFLEKLKEYSSNYHVIDAAIHLDEATPHMHIRGIYDYTDANGDLQIGQERALKEMGIKLPDPEAPEGRYNNRKISFHKELREIWYGICEEHGIDIDREPDKENQQHMRIRELIIKRQEEEIKQNDEKIAAQQEEIEEKNRELETLQQIVLEEQRKLEEERGRKKAKKLLRQAGLADYLGSLTDTIDKDI